LTVLEHDEIHNRMARGSPWSGEVEADWDLSHAEEAVPVCVRV